MHARHHPSAVYKTKSKLYMVMELADGGELFDRVVKKKHYSEHEACSCFVQVRWTARHDTTHVAAPHSGISRTQK